MTKPLVFLLLSLLLATQNADLPDSKRASDVRAAVWPRLEQELSYKRFEGHSPVYLRIFKDESLMEIWVQSDTRYFLFKTYDVCYFSGGLGTKKRANDGKSPEGFYTIAPKQLNPVSNYYLAINVGYPNKLEILKGYTGNAIMVHGNCASIGCYAMTDAQISEIYTLVYKAFEAGQQTINLDIFPFRMDEAHLKKYASSYPDQAFLKTLKPGYDLFEKNHMPTTAQIKGNEYFFGD